VNPLLEKFITLFGDILKQTELFPGERVAVEVLINPMAGVLRSTGKLRRMLNELQQFKQVQKKDWKSPGINVQFHITESMNHAQQKALSLLIGFMEEQWAQKKILILAGGDGFHKDICTALIRSGLSMENLSVFRLPLGTGNDSSDCHSLSEACSILTGVVELRQEPYLKVLPRNLPVDYSFNITSFGLDAYVCELTEIWKRRIPGDIYKAMVDLSVLFYDRKYPIRSSRVSWQGPRGKGQDDGRKLLLVMAAQGYRSYGGQKAILPDDHNLLMADWMPVRKRILLKGKFMDGSHQTLPEAHFHFAHHLTLDYDEPLLMELDGEVTPLEKENFPVTIEVIKEKLNILQKKS